MNIITCWELVKPQLSTICDNALNTNNTSICHVSNSVLLLNKLQGNVEIHSSYFLRNCIPRWHAYLLNANFLMIFSVRIYQEKQISLGMCLVEISLGSTNQISRSENDNSIRLRNQWKSL